ncbi:hypothetical protein [Paenibacillus pini]|uniref:Uncharacterized protein n=1 Tax=Paenibacillus pini JCM 16418 TaxID=1236976 RepID=W7Z2S8_9BACL|nr:hypothetical protein [Paenibacillus pini]GAF08744.1 hypothetical protein JCM16418_2848 [Paenibacillus pini JCM 16418]
MNFKGTTATAAALVLALAIQTGSGVAEAAKTPSATLTQTPQLSAEMKHANAIYTHTLQLLKQNKLAEAVSYMEKYISGVTLQQATIMTLKLENAQLAARPAWNKKIISEANQRALMKLATDKYDLTFLMNRTKDKKLRTLLQGARDSGYQLQTSEGMFYLVMDYPRYQKFRSFVTADIKSYIDIMTTETNKPFSNDAALMISWSEVTNRALTQQKFVKSFPVSNRAKQVQSLYNNYLNITFTGLNNTPLFDYEHNKMDAMAKAAYQKVLDNNSIDNNSYLKKLQGFLDVLAKNNDMLTPEVEKYSKSVLPKQMKY